jgi:putative glutamine amidotransferase
LIGITINHDSNTGMVGIRPEYPFGIAEAGGIPVLLAVPGADVPEDRWMGVLDRLDGLLLSGGPDIDPAEFGEPPLRGLDAVSPERDRFELGLARGALDRGLPLLGICRGVQTIAVAAGGTLYQDINTQVAGVYKHRQQAPRFHTTHEVRLIPGSAVHHAHGREAIMVNSFHHQSVKDLPPGFATTALSGDGIIEAIESSTNPRILGVQWHPEGIWAHDRFHLAVFRWLVAAAGGPPAAVSQGEA